MGVMQDKFVQRTVTRGNVTVLSADGSSSQQKLVQSKTGALASGVPGGVVDLAFGPVVHTAEIAAEAGAKVGTFVAGQGVLISPNEYALRGGLGPSMMLTQGMCGEFMTAGHVWVLGADVAGVLEGMNGRILGAFATTAYTDTDLVPVEVLGLKEEEESSSSS